MSINPVVAPFPLFQDRDGQPLEAGFIYIGTANLDPTTNPIAIFWDSALTISAAQPVRTINGYASRNGSPGALFAASDFSITVKDKKGLLVVTNPSGARSGLGDVVLAAGESLTAQAGSSIDVEDGATVGIGTGTGTGVLVTLASNARFVGDIIPNVNATQSLGSSTRRWDAQLDVVAAGQLTVGSNVLTTTGGTVGTLAAALTSVVADDIVSGASTCYASATVAASPAAILGRNQQTAIAACGSISAAAAIGANHFNVDTASVVGPGVYDIVLDEPVEDDAICGVFVTSLGTDLQARGFITTSGTTLRVNTYQGTPGAATSQGFTFIIIGRPRGGVVSPIV